MKRYALFSGDWYYPAGGWDDLAGTFDSIDEAIAAFAPGEYMWAQIVDLHEGVIVLRWAGQKGWEEPTP